MTEQELFRLARKRTEAKLGFYIHAAVYVVVMIVLFAINYLAASNPWAIFPFLGWGLGLAIHGVVALGVVGSGFREQLLKSEVAKLKNEQVVNP